MQDFEGTVYTFGFGSDHNGDLLTAISNAANGVYYFIDSTEKVSILCRVETNTCYLIEMCLHNCWFI